MVGKWNNDSSIGHLVAYADTLVEVLRVDDVRGGTVVVVVGGVVVTIEERRLKQLGTHLREEVGHVTQDVHLVDLSHEAHGPQLHRAPDDLNTVLEDEHLRLLRRVEISIRQGHLVEVREEDVVPIGKRQAESLRVRRVSLHRLPRLGYSEI